MNNLPQNELLSAYLDGELTAAEQADVERMLAANPAARQLLDELRALSTALQSLPQQKLGKDLSGQVLRVAERRMLTEGEPDEAAPSPAVSEPFSRMIFRRFLNRRAMVWTGLAVAVAVMISLNESRQKDRLADRELVRAPAVTEKDKSEKPIGKLVELPAIRAVPDTSARSVVTSPAKRRSEKSPASKPMADQFVEKETVEKKTADKLPGGQGEGMVEEGRPSQMPAEEKSVSPARGTESRPLAKSRPPLPPTSMGKAGPGVFRKGGGYGGNTVLSNVQQVDATASDVLVVYCDISPDAAKKRSFDKLLDANGIAWRREWLRKSENLTNRYQSHNNAKGPVQGGQEQQVVAGATLRQTIASGNTELVYVEATPAQVRAALAGLEAQPSVFLSYSVSPAPDELSRQFANHFQKERGVVESKPAGGDLAFSGQDRPKSQEDSRSFQSPKSAKSAVAKKSDVAANNNNVNHAPAKAAKDGSRSQEPGAVTTPSGDKSQTQANATATVNSQEPQAVPANQPSDSKQKEADGQRDSSHSESVELYAQSAPRQRVLFVLRVGGGSLPAAAVQVRSKANAAASQPAPASPSPAEHAPSK